VTDETTQEARAYCLDAEPVAGDRYAYVKRGLACRKVGKGRWQVRRSDGRKLDQISVQVALKEPWASQVSSSVDAGCAVHGESCPPDSDDCSTAYLAGTTRRWVAQVKAEPTSPYLFEVHVSEVPMVLLTGMSQQELLEARERIAAGTRLADGAGFSVVLVSSS